MRKWVPTLMLIFFAARAGAYTVPYEMWMGTFVGDSNIEPVPTDTGIQQYGGVTR